MADSQSAEDFFSVAEQLLDRGIAALKALIPIIWLQSKTTPIQFLVGGTVVLLVSLLLGISPPQDPAEPPLIKPRIPVVGHFWGLFRGHAAYFTRLYDRTKLPIATVTVGHQKLYVIYDGALQQAALRAKDMDAQTLMVDAVALIFGVHQTTVDTLLGRDGVHPSIMAPMEHVFKLTLQGENMSRLARTALGALADTLNSVDNAAGGIPVPNLYRWLQTLVSQTTSKALWGEHNPYQNGSLISAQWEFDDNVSPVMMLGIFPSLLARKAHRARVRIAAALERYFSARHDSDSDSGASAFVRERSRLLRSYGVDDGELARNETAITLVATSNAVSTLFWCLAEVFARPDLLRDVRAEAARAVIVTESGRDSQETAGKGQWQRATVPAVGLEARVPLLASAYRDAIRLASQSVASRRVLRDTVILGGGGGGPSYLLKAGTDVFLPAKQVHRDRAVWGDDAEAFNARRFLSRAQGGDASDDTLRLRKAAFVPFGGGKHLCPGRHFAFVENLATMTALALGFELDGLDAVRLDMAESKRGETAKPVPGMAGGPVVLRRRKGWEHVVWEFSC
ncbi:cytochrome P450 [Lasiosphaeria miniovina]|uniref:Cytochrome P450 n=1 Tax=Lasiosphaeria miniovina TaxID=1954250 RepID=A0AA40ADT1_9PEZI|nr:cytochrome P450 [Lasiosphaeria miniovina]KAK0714087.1 cytochrome P450 [Lasiosphaeria miniovina]